MLVLSRKRGERVKVGDGIMLAVADIYGDGVRVDFTGMPGVDSVVLVTGDSFTFAGIELRVLACSASRAKLGFVGPPSIPVCREEAVKQHATA